MAGLDVATNDRFERRWQVFEIACWTAMFLVVLAALLGGLGGGLIGHHRAELPGLTIEFDSLARLHTPTHLVIWRADPGPTVQVRLPIAMLQKIDVTRTSPRPIAVISDSEGIAFRFAGGDGGRLQFTMEPQAVGPAAGWITVGATRTRFRQFVLP